PIGTFDKPKWMKSPQSTTPQPAAGNEADVFFALAEPIDLVLTGTGLDNYVYDFSIFLRTRDAGGHVTFGSPIDTIPGITGSATEVRTSWSVGHTGNSGA